MCFLVPFHIPVHLEVLTLILVFQKIHESKLPTPGIIRLIEKGLNLAILKQRKNYN